MALRYYVSSEEAPFFVNNKMGSSDRIPTSGTYKVGDFIISNTQANGVFGWVCTQAGTPGTWIEIGTGGSNTKTLSLSSSTVVSSPVREVAIGIKDFNKNTDFLMVYKNSTYLTEGVDYDISSDSTKIVSRTGNWNADSLGDYRFSFVVIKEVEKVNPEAVVGTENIKDSVVTMSKLGEDVKERLDGFDSQLEHIVKMPIISNGNDDTSMLQDFFSNNYTNVKIKGTYYINIKEGQHLCYYENIENINIDCSEAKFIEIRDNYSNNGAITTLFKFNNCKNIDIKLNYEGKEIEDKNNLLGYTGLALVWLQNNCKYINVSINADNCRYGLLAGNFTDFNLGNNNNIKLNINGYGIGYPIALYNSNNVTGNINVDTFHRASYLAGVSNCDLKVLSRNQYIADIVNLVTDCLVDDNTSKGCNNLNIQAIDTGSTVYPESSFLTGISLSRSIPCTFENIIFNFNIEANNTVATKVGGFTIASNFKYSSGNIFKNIELKGVIDRTNQTVESGVARDIRVITKYDNDNSATCENFTLNFKLLGDYVGDKATYVKGDIKNLEINMISEGNGLYIEGNNNVIFTNSILKSLSTYGGVNDCTFINTTLKQPYSSDTYTVNNFNSTINNNNCYLKTKKITTKLEGSTVNIPYAIPTGALVLGVTGFIKETIKGATGLKIGVKEELERYCNANITEQGTNITIGYQNNTVSSPLFYKTGGELVVTSRTSDFTGGVIELYINYISFN